MAAVLCQGVGKLCGSICDCIGAICKAPFQLCGSCLDCCGQCCKGTCEGCGQCCTESCQLVTNCCSSGFCCYITVTCLLNGPPIIIGLMDIPNAIAGCTGSLWLLVFWLLCVVNIVAAFYMSVAIQKDDSILPTTSSSGEGGGGMSQYQQNAQNGVSRVKHLFCYDVWMAGYILVLCGFFAWLLVGGGWFAASDSMDGDADKCDSVAGPLGIAYACGWAWIFCGGCSLCCSLCCGVCTGSYFTNSSSPPTGGTAYDWRQNQQQQPRQQPQQQYQSTSTTMPAASAPVPAAAKVDNTYGSSTYTKREPSAPSADDVPMAEAVPIHDNTGKKM